LRKKGAEILLVPSAFTKVTGIAHWHVLLRARAIENQCYVIAAAQTGKHNDGLVGEGGQIRESYGHACIIDPWGTVITEINDGIGLAFADINLNTLHNIRRSMPVHQHSRPELFK